VRFGEFNRGVIEILTKGAAQPHRGQTTPTCHGFEGASAGRCSS